MITEIIVFIIVLVAIFFPFLELSSVQVKGYIKLAASFVLVPFLITLMTSWVRSSEADFVSVMLLQGGITSILLAVGYGVSSGLLLYGLKVYLRSLIGKSQQSD